jgi:hypothetical protein
MLIQKWRAEIKKNDKIPPQTLCFFIVVVQQQIFLLVAGKASKMDGRGFGRIWP